VVPTVPDTPVAATACWDQLGIAASLLCAVHCLAVPLLLPFLGVLGLGFLARPGFELGMIALAALLGFSAITLGFWRHHRTLLPIYPLAVGFLLFTAAKGGLTGEEWEGVLVPAGALFIAASHGLNWWLCRTCPVCRDEGLPRCPGA